MTRHPTVADRKGSAVVGRRAGAAVLVAALLAGGAWLTRSPPAEPPQTGVVTIRTAPAPATAPPPAVATTPPPLTPTKAIVRAEGNARVDPPLDTLLATAGEDVRTLHDQIAQQSPGGRDAARESLLTATFSGSKDVRVVRVICAGVICEIAGTAATETAVAGESVGDRLAQQSLEVGPVAFAPAAGPGSGRMFVLYVTSAAEG